MNFNITVSDETPHDIEVCSIHFFIFYISVYCFSVAPMADFAVNNLAQ